MLKDPTSRALCALGVDRLATAFNAEKLLIVTYHGVVGAQLDPPCPWHIEDALFRTQAAWLARDRSVISLEECVRRMRDGVPLPHRPAAVTFDDGYRSVRTRALPVLEELGIPATVFVVTGEIGSQRLLWHDALYLAIALTAARELDLTGEGGARYTLASAALKRKALTAAAAVLKVLEPADRNDALLAITDCLGVDPAQRAESEEFALLAAEEIATMAQGGRVAFGAHGQSHVALTLLPEAAAHQEVCGSVARTRQITGARDVPFAYPYGQTSDFDGTVSELVRASGATCALTAVPGLNARDADPFTLRRIGVGAGLSASRFRLRVSGLSGWGLRGVRDLLLARVARGRTTLRPLRRFWREVAFRRETILLFAKERGEKNGLSATAERDRMFHFGRASACELRRFADRLAPRDTGGFLKRVDRRFADGISCFVIRRGTGIVASAWVSEAALADVAEIERSIDIGRNAVYIFDASTVPAWRGHGLYPMLLDRIAQFYGDKTKVIAASTKNAASLRGIQKARFSLVARYRFLKLAGVVIRGRPVASVPSPRPS